MRADDRTDVNCIWNSRRNQTRGGRRCSCDREGVKQGWGVYLNGKRLGNLVRSESRLEHSLPIPPQGLRAGKNTLSVRAPKSVDDIEVGRFRLFDGSAYDALKFGIIDVQVTEAGNQLPARITVAHTDDTLAALSAAQFLHARRNRRFDPGWVSGEWGRTHLRSSRAIRGVPHGV